MLYPQIHFGVMLTERTVNGSTLGISTVLLGVSEQAYKDNITTSRQNHPPIRIMRRSIELNS